MTLPILVAALSYYCGQRGPENRIKIILKNIFKKIEVYFLIGNIKLRNSAIKVGKRKKKTFTFEITCYFKTLYR